MTRFKTGSRVEVLSHRDVASSSWYPGEIIHGNGHYYTIKYEDGAFDRVPRRRIRPCPPPFQLQGLDWVSGDIIEVFHCFSWKMATVLRALQTGLLLVRLLGSSHEIEVRQVDARPRVFLHRDQWNLVGKGSSNSGKRKTVDSMLNNHNGGTEEGKDGITSSVASCSMSAKNNCEIPPNFLTAENDAESFCPNQSELPCDQVQSEEIHRLELNGYRSILGALFASGRPLSWDQQTLLTDLRNSLHITNDEHLMELRILVSSSS